MGLNNQITLERLIQADTSAFRATISETNAGSLRRDTSLRAQSHDGGPCATAVPSALRLCHGI